MDAPFLQPSNVRHGRFLWMSDAARNDYLQSLKARIADGHFFKESVLATLAEDLAPLYVDGAVGEYP